MSICFSVGQNNRKFTTLLTGCLLTFGKRCGEGAKEIFNFLYTSHFLK